MTRFYHALKDQATVLKQRFLCLLKYGEWEFPCCFTLEISSPCNRRCHYCININGYQPKREMSESTLTTCIERLQEVNWHGDVSFNYLNEPLLDKRLPKFVSLVRKGVSGCRIMLITNGDFLTAPLAQELIDCGVDQFLITRHPPYNDKWDEKISTLASSYPNHIQVRQIEGATWLTTWGGKIKLAGLKPYKTCKVITSTYTVLADGRVQMCCCDSEQENIVGDLNNQGILEIWRSENFKAIRRQAQSGHPTKPICVACYESRLVQPAA
jgi:GTP 3',8-cyclase